VGHVVEKQIECGIDVGNNGEQPRVGFQTYVPQRMKGFGGESQRPIAADMLAFPKYFERTAEMLLQDRAIGKIMNAPQAVTDVSYEDLEDYISALSTEMKKEYEYIVFVRLKWRN
jgi:5-methyltetrahydropteroyltriglutamate--homocysteine methyltransferase